MPLERVLSRVCLLVVLAAATTAACARPHPQATPSLASTRVIVLDTLRPLPRVRLAEIRSYDLALGAALGVIENDLHFPTLSASVFIFPDREALRLDLVRAGDDAEHAARVAAALDGISSSDRIRINHEAMERMPWPDRVRLLAHELTHIVEYQLSGGRRAGSEQWLREGFAEWVSFKVLEALGSRSLSFERDAAIVSLRPASRSGRLPRLAQLSSASDWMTAIERARPSYPVYRVAFLATDELVRRHGIESVLGYFSRGGSSADRAANFARAFGETLPDFDRLSQGRLARYIEEADPLALTAVRQPASRPTTGPPR